MAFVVPTPVRANPASPVASALTSHNARLSHFHRRSTGRRSSARMALADAQQPASNSPHSLDTLLQTLRSREQDLSPHDSHTRLGQNATSTSTVYLVGTGPGDPGLLTLRALHLMHTAHIVLYDRLVSPSILSFVNPRATMVYVGKEAGFHTRSQQDIHLLLSFFATPDATVVRLKGGDPFVFGRGGEEVDFLERAGIRVVAVPGITAASGIAAALGIPLTMRGIATSVRFLTGHLAATGDFDFAPLDPLCTHVIYMGLSHLQSICESLQAAGIDGKVAAVAVERGTTTRQRVLAHSVDALAASVEDAGFESPTLVVVGEVVALAPCWRRRGEVLEGLEMDALGAGLTGPDDPIVRHALDVMRVDNNQQV